MNNAAQKIETFDSIAEENSFLKRENNFLREDVIYLEELVRHLRRQRFSPSSEVFAKGQGTIFNESEELAVNDDDEDLTEPAPEPKTKKRGNPKRKPLPADLPRVDKIIDLAANEKFCPKSGLALVKIGEEVSEKLDIEPAKPFVVRTIRPKYGCQGACCTNNSETPTTFKTAAPEAQAIPKSMAAPGLLAHVAVCKFVDAMPLYRQEESLARIGIDIPRSTLANWMIECGKLVMPLINLAKEALLNGPVIYADETRIQVLKRKGKKATAESYMWVFLNINDTGRMITIFELGPSRAHTVPLKFLAGYDGYLHTDGYDAYDAVAAKMPQIMHVGDWVHARRKFDEAIKAHPSGVKQPSKAKIGLELINKLFKIEREMGDVSRPERLRIRQNTSLPIAEKLKKWLDDTVNTLPGKSLTGSAMKYALGQWPKLLHTLNDPILRLDTNLVENAVRPFVIGRNNWLFSDTVAGAEASAALYSLMSMAKANGQNRFEYLRAVFTDLPKAKTVDDIEALLPWRWKADTPCDT